MSRIGHWLEGKLMQKKHWSDILSGTQQSSQWHVYLKTAKVSLNKVHLYNPLYIPLWKYFYIK